MGGPGARLGGKGSCQPGHRDAVGGSWKERDQAQVPQACAPLVAPTVPLGFQQWG